MKRKTYEILKWIPIVNLILPKPATYCSYDLEHGIHKTVFDYIAKHPELKDQLLTEKLVNEILSKNSTH